MITQKTVTHIAEPEDNRCKWWQSILPTLKLSCLTERTNIDYLKKGADLELADTTLLIDSEERHHRKARGYRVRLGFVSVENDDVYWLTPTAKIKAFLKKEKQRQDLMEGSGEVTAVMRIALYLQALPKSAQYPAFEELQNLD